MKTAISTLSTLIALTSILALPACVGNAGDLPSEAVDQASESLLYGLSEGEITSLFSLASSPMTLEAWIDLHRGAFDCGNYGDLCRRVGPEAAYSITESSYRLGLDGATRDDINAFLSDEIDAAAETWKAANGEKTDDVRDSNVVTDTGSANDERVRTEIFAVKPAVGTWYVQNDCTYQTKGAFGVWGGSNSANLKATWSGHLHETSGATYDQSSTYVTATIFAHSITTTKLYFYPDMSSHDLHGFGECDASKNGWSAHAETSVLND